MPLSALDRRRFRNSFSYPFLTSTHWYIELAGLVVNHSSHFLRSSRKRRKESHLTSDLRHRSTYSRCHCCSHSTYLHSHCCSHKAYSCSNCCSLLTYSLTHYCFLSSSLWNKVTRHWGFPLKCIRRIHADLTHKCIFFCTSKVAIGLTMQKFYRSEVAWNILADISRLSLNSLSNFDFLAINIGTKL